MSSDTSSCFALSRTRVFGEDRRAHTQRQRDGVARSGIDRHELASHHQMDDGVERVLLQVADHDVLHVRLEVVDDVP